MKYDAIIIGGGLGGLTAGAKLAIEGKKILLLEQHDRPGGCATTFQRKDFTMEVGLHEMDGLHAADGKVKIFKELGLFEGVEYLELPEFYRFVHGSTNFVMPHDREKAILKLKEMFPSESAGIDTYFDRLMNARRINVIERNKPDISIGEYLDSILSDEELKLILMGNLGYFHDDPYSLSLRYFSVAEGSYFHGRANFIRGGSQVLSNRLVDIIRQHGGKVLLHHQVNSLTFENGKITAASFTNSLDHSGTVIEAMADQFLAGAALPEINNLISHNISEEISKEINKQPVGASLLTVYYGFSKPLFDLGSRYYSTFVFDESVRTLHDIKKNNRAGFDKRGFTFVDYSQVNSDLAPKGKSVGAICCIDYLDDWEGLTREEYKKKKAEAQEQLTARLEKLVPGLRSAIAHIETGTARTVKRYTKNTGGAVYGFAQLPGKETIKSLEKISNLHVASAWGKFGGGFSGAIYNGYMAAVDALRNLK